MGESPRPSPTVGPTPAPVRPGGRRGPGRQARRGVLPAAAGARLGVGTVTVLVLLTVALPLVGVVHSALAPGVATTGAPLLRSFLRSLLLATTVALLGSGLALCTALTAQSLPPRSRHVLDLLVCAPAVMPPGAVAVAVLAAAGNAGWMDIPVARSPVHGFPGLLASMLIAFLPLAHLVNRATLRSLDPRTLEGARMAGAGSGRILRHVVLPHLRPAVALGATVLLVTSLSDPAIPAVLRGLTPNIAHLALDSTTGWGPDVVAARAGLLVAVPALLLVPVVATVRSRLSPVWSPGALSPRLDLPGGTRGGVVLLPALLHALVCGALVVTTVHGALECLTRPDTGTVLADSVRAVLSTLVLSALACLLCLPLATATVRATRTFHSHVPGASQLVLLLLVLPGTTVGIAFSLATRVPHTLGPLDIPALVGGSSLAHGRIGILLMLMTIALPLLHLGLGALWDAVPRAVLDSARDAGAGTTRLVTVVLLPSTGLLVGALAAVALGRCLVAVVPLVYVTSPETALVASRVLDLADHARTPEVLLVAVLTAASVGFMLALAQAALGHLLPGLGGPRT